MEWSKDKTLKLIGLMQVNANLWNPSISDSRRDKLKRREELRAITDILGITVADATKKIQHLRTQYNRESAREARSNAESPNEKYFSNWYAYEYLHFLKDSTKPYRVLQSISTSTPMKLEYPSPPKSAKDDISIFGEYVANELRTLKGEKNLLIAKKKILDVIFEAKIDYACEQRQDPNVCTVYTHGHRNRANSIHSDKDFTTPVLNTQLEALHATPTTEISQIIINSACNYSEYKVDTQ